MSVKPVIALGVTGSIAAYKAAALCSLLTKKGYDVNVLMTQAACRLVREQTFLTLSRNPVITSLWEVPQWQPGHIALAERAQLLVVAPATANFIGKYSQGIADDALTTYALSHSGAVIIAQAMNPRMWRHPAVQDNITRLKERHTMIVGPATGSVACGDAGPGRMADVEDIVAAITQQLSQK